MPDSIPPKGMGPGRSMGPGKIGRKRIGPSGKDPSMIPKGVGPFGRIPNVDKDGDPFTKRQPYKKPGNNSFF